MKTPTLSIVLPCYNEAAGLESSIQFVIEKLNSLVQTGRISKNSSIVFVDDGSSDATWDIITVFHQKLPNIVFGVRFSVNRGKEIALLAGVLEARKMSDVVCCMDADLQFDINALDEFIEYYYEGYDLVYGVKRNRGKEPLIKKACALIFYKLMWMLGMPVENNHTDYCLMTKKVCDALSEYGESFVIFRGLLKNLGFKQKACYFDVLNRQAGESHFSFMKLLSLSLDAITSFSVVPLRIITLSGLCVILVGLAMVVYSIISFFNDNPPDGYTTLACSLWIIGGYMTVCMGILGEYLGKTYVETKKRPRYFISERLM